MLQLHVAHICTYVPPLTVSFAVIISVGNLRKFTNSQGVGNMGNMGILAGPPKLTIVNPFIFRSMCPCPANKIQT